MKIKACIILILVSACGVACAQEKTADVSGIEDPFAHEGPECPQDLPLVRDRLERFLLSEKRTDPGSMVEMRDKFVRKDQIVILEDRQDREVCRYLNDYFAKTLATKVYSEEDDVEYYDADAIYYKGQGYYFALLVVNSFPQACYQQKSSEASGCRMVGMNVYDEDMTRLTLISLDY